MLKANYQDQSLKCKLTGPELRKRKAAILSDVKNKVIEKNEIKNGFKYKFPGEDKMLDLLTYFIQTERQCCQFFDFNLYVAGNPEKYMVLQITGPEGVKKFIKDELNL